MKFKTLLEALKAIELDEASNWDEWKDSKSYKMAQLETPDDLKDLLDDILSDYYGHFTRSPQNLSSILDNKQINSSTWDGESSNISFTYDPVMFSQRDKKWKYGLIFDNVDLLYNWVEKYNKAYEKHRFYSNKLKGDYKPSYQLHAAIFTRNAFKNFLNDGNLQITFIGELENPIENSSNGWGKYIIKFYTYSNYIFFDDTNLYNEIIDLLNIAFKYNLSSITEHMEKIETNSSVNFNDTTLTVKPGAFKNKKTSQFSSIKLVKSASSGWTLDKIKNALKQNEYYTNWSNERKQKFQDVNSEIEKIEQEIKVNLRDHTKRLKSDQDIINNVLKPEYWDKKKESYQKWKEKHPKWAEICEKWRKEHDGKWPSKAEREDLINNFLEESKTKALNLLNKKNTEEFEDACKKNHDWVKLNNVKKGIQNELTVNVRDHGMNTTDLKNIKPLVIALSSKQINMFNNATNEAEVTLNSFFRPVSDGNNYHSLNPKEAVWYNKDIALTKSGELELKDEDVTKWYFKFDYDDIKFITLPDDDYELFIQYSQNPGIKGLSKDLRSLFETLKNCFGNSIKEKVISISNFTQNKI